MLGVECVVAILMAHFFSFGVLIGVGKIGRSSIQMVFCEFEDALKKDGGCDCEKLASLGC